MRRAILAVLAGLASLLTITPAAAQTSPSDYTYAARYDAERRVTGTIAPDPDGPGPLHYAAVRNTYDASGNLIRVEKGELASWQSETIAPSAWTGFTVFSQVDTAYDALDRKWADTVSAGGVAYAVTQYSYDVVGRLECTTVRMNPSAYTSLPSSACTLSTAGSYGSDRITKNVYDNAGQLLRVQKAYGTSLQQDYVTYTYSNNGKVLTVKDANGNKAGYTYDGFDRQTQWNFPDKVTIGTISSTDYEAYTYDANGNRLSLRKRDGSVIGYTYDNLNRVTVKDIPGGTSADVYYGYDLRGLQTFALFASTSGAGTTNSYDGFGRLATSSSNNGFGALTLSYQYDADGNRSRLTYPDGKYVSYAYDGLDRMTNAGWSTSSWVFLGIPYDSQGRRAATYVGGVTTGYGYDAISRLTTDSLTFASGPVNNTSTYSYSPANQITSKTRSNNAYAWSGYASISRSYFANGLNQYSTAGSASFTYDANGNLTGDGTYTYGYDVENRLTSKNGGLSIAYDPNGRLWQTSGGSSGTTRYLYDGDNLVAEYNGSGTMISRYVFGPGSDEPILWDSGTAMNCTDSRFLYADEQGSIVTAADCSGNPIYLNSYDEYGIPASGNSGRFQYTGQAWLPDLGMYYYKARIYSPTLGRFMQTDPIGYADQNNLYAYVSNSPINGRDPSGEEEGDIVVSSSKCPPYCKSSEGVPILVSPVPPPLAMPELPKIKIGWPSLKNFRHNWCDWVGAFCKEAADVSDPDSLDGKTAEEVEEAAKEAGYTEEGSTRGEGGKKLVKPDSGGRQIRIMPGNPGASDPVKRGPYVRVPLDSPGGTKISDPIPLKGNKFAK